MAVSLEITVEETGALMKGFDAGASLHEREPRACTLLFADDLGIQWAYDLGRTLGARAHWRHN